MHNRMIFNQTPHTSYIKLKRVICVKVPWSSDGSLTERRIEHFQHLEEEPSGEAPDGSGEEGREKEAFPPDRYPYPRFWEAEEEQL